MEAEAVVLQELTDGVLTVTLNRPNKYNALNYTVASEITTICKQAGRDTAIRCIVITGAGKGFCAGQDLTEVEDRGDNFSFRDHLLRGYNRMVIAMRSLEKPIIVAVNGACRGRSRSGTGGRHPHRLRPRQVSHCIHRHRPRTRQRRELLAAASHRPGTRRRNVVHQ